MTNDPVCEICEAPATRVMDGGNYCSLCDQYAITDWPAPCAVCGEPATTVIAGRDLCDLHCEHEGNR